MAPMDAIKSATSVAAKHLSIDSNVGAIALGKRGDLVAVKGDPLTDMTALRRISVCDEGRQSD